MSGELVAMKGDRGGNSKAVRTYGKHQERKVEARLRRRQQDKIAAAQKDQGRRDRW